MPNHWKRRSWSAVLLLGLVSTLSAQPSFVEVADQAGLGTDYEIAALGFGSGAAAADYDNDGFVDVFVPTAGGTGHQLYRNLGNGSFEEVAASVGITGTERGRAGLWLDYNGDHRLDLLINNDCFEISCDGAGSFLRLFRQTPEGSFEDVTDVAGLTQSPLATDQHQGGMAAGDVNGDRYIDFVSGVWEGTLKLFLNQGDGTFMDASAVSGLDGTVLAYHQPVMQDLNGDGLIDIYAAVDFSENRLWINQGSSNGIPTFLEVAEQTACDNAMNDMGVALGDVDGDLDPDLYITNIFRLGFHNVLLKNDLSGGVLLFSEISEAAGLDDGGWGWGTSFVDIDNDGDLDLAETNGWHTSTWDQPLRLFIHQGDQPPTFVDMAPTAGLTSNDWGSALVAFDFDRDGDLDLVETVPKLADNPNSEDLRLHRNELDRGLGDRRYLVIKPRMAGANHWAVGARVLIEYAGEQSIRWIGAGTSYLGQEPAEAFFGLGATGIVDRVTVYWPDGKTTVLSAVAADQTRTITDDVIFFSGFESGDTAGWSP